MRYRVTWSETDVLIDVVNVSSPETAKDIVADDHNLCIDDLSAQSVRSYNREILSRPWWELEAEGIQF